ncbi:hypothetical protein AU468_08885 [Alkalispirochaeta sphaeroplastigenens]|uniref:Phospholipid/glycerol acyltransferase domain-containing protein n=1 Tax=Alkalispirochaeta sphaeroplastigenens TaxID=1187066 RepID=A0A2S4JN75_9SPIO|nr:1-acyl-sn-glycerol-3-phosphate acyltransferase [Alkalispirochaeta sphaeroplastigenens]POR00976.1 hypothetical protein AU468_08885 [Alkalispirochaeta sphaeroplastigenens]
MIQIDEQFKKITEQLIRNSRQQQAVNPDCVFQPANISNRVLVEQIISKLVLPGSRITGYENLLDLFERARKGESCILLLEHYSNFDIPCFFYLAQNYDQGTEVLDSIVAMAGAKLNEESRFVLAFTEAYTRLVIYPARSLAALEGTPKYDEARNWSRSINRSALREMIRLKNSGHMVLLFPAGTRYRPGQPQTKEILLETDSYIKGFDHMVMVGIAGNTLRVNPSGTMDQDIPGTDVMVYNASPVTSTREFRAAARQEIPEGGDEAKRAVTKAIEKEFEKLHLQAEETRVGALRGLAEKGVQPTSIEFPGGRP